jgi:hypothetical protein
LPRKDPIFVRHLELAPSTHSRCMDRALGDPFAVEMSQSLDGLGILSINSCGSLTPLSLGRDDRLTHPPCPSTTTLTTPPLLLIYQARQSASSAHPRGPHSAAQHVHPAPHRNHPGCVGSLSILTTSSRWSAVVSGMASIAGQNLRQCLRPGLAEDVTDCSLRPVQVNVLADRYAPRGCAPR